MAITGDGFDIIGISVGKRGPVGPLVHLDLDPGVTALYGLNGAGKSWVLRLAHAALSGVLNSQESDEIADVHLRVHHSQTPPSSGFVTALRDCLGLALDVRRGTLRRLSGELDPVSYGWEEDVTGLWSEFEELGARAIGQDLWSHAAALIDAAGIADSSGSTTRTLPAEVREALYLSADAGLITLRATGAPDAPSWDVFLPLSSVHDESARLLQAGLPGWNELRRILSLDRGEEQTQLLGDYVSRKRHFRVWEHGLDGAAYFGMQGKSKSSIDWPSWVGVPVFKVGESLSTPPVRVLDNEDTADVNAETVRRLLEPFDTTDTSWADAERRSVALDFDGTVSDALEAATRAIEAAAMEILAAVLMDAPALRFNWRTPVDWLRGMDPGWEYLDDGRPDWLPLDSLSDARLRWSRDALRLATTGSHLPTVLLSDEPERGLHRLAERRLATGLGRMATGRGVSIVAATHSPALLDSTFVRPHLVGRDHDGFVKVSAAPLTLTGDLDSSWSAAQLGLSFSDLASLMKVAVLVEGLHDEWVINDQLRSTLDNSLAQLFPMHGAKRAQSLADARFLFGGTDAHLLVVLDNLSSGVQATWEAAASAHQRGFPDQAIEILKPLLEERKQRGDEYLFLHQLALRAIETNRIDRIRVFGLSRPDIICYLPPDLLLSDCQLSWDDLLERWRASFGEAPASNLKGWLKAEGLLPTDPNEIDRRIRDVSARVARAHNPMHADLVALAARIVELGSTS